MTEMIEVPRTDSPKQNFLDRAVSWVSPVRGAQRQFARAKMEFMRSRTERFSGVGARQKPNMQVVREIGDSRARSQELDETNAIANGLVTRCCENVIGSGVRPQAATNSKVYNRNVEAMLKDYFAEQADVRGLGDFYTHLQPLWFRSHLVGGDMGVIMLKSGQLQSVDADAISTPTKLSGNTNVVDGVEMNHQGRPVRFHIESGGLHQDGKPYKHTAIAARDFIYYPRLRTLRDTRGWPIFHQNDKYFDQMDGYIESVICAAQMAAMFGLLIKQEGGTDETMPTLHSGKDANGNAVKLLDLEPAMIQHLAMGESVEQIKPEQPTQNAPEFMRMMMRFAGLPIGIPLELALLDFSETNYSSARASLAQAHRMFMAHQQRFISLVLRRIYRWRVSKWIKEGKLKDRPDAWRHEWIAPGWPYIDPEKEMGGNLLALDAGLTTLSKVAASMGHDWEQLLIQRKVELDMMKKLGITLVRSKKSRPDDGPADGPDKNEDEPDKKKEAA